MAQKQLRKLCMQKNELEYQRDNYQLTLRDIATQIAENEALLKGLNEALAGLPEGKVKDEYIDKRVQAVYANFELNRRRKHYPPERLLEKELFLERINKDCEMVEAFIEIINTHRLSLQKTLDAGQQVENKNPPTG
jgi:hypothetical protein